jgi:ABC-2 type transport system ATP-binding protein
VIVNSLSYGIGARDILRDVSFHVLPGRVTLLLGPNGAGKTTLFSLIAGLLAPQSGSIRLPRGRDGLSIVFQQPALDLDLTVRQNLSYHGGLFGMTAPQIETATAPLLHRLDLFSRLAEKVRSLNGGHRRRVEIIRALMTSPSLLLLDEPTAGLDAPTRKALVEFLHAMARERSMAVLWATHLTDESEPGDEVIVLHQGLVRAQGSLKAVMDQAEASTLEHAFLSLTQRKAT